MKIDFNAVAPLKKQAEDVRAGTVVTVGERVLMRVDIPGGIPARANRVEFIDMQAGNLVLLDAEALVEPKPNAILYVHPLM